MLNERKFSPEETFSNKLFPTRKSLLLKKRMVAEDLEMDKNRQQLNCIKRFKMNCRDINNWWQRRKRDALNTLYLLFLGQVVSFTLALGSFTSSLLANLGVDAPITQSSFVYFTLAVVYGSILLYRRQKLQISWYWYLLLGFVDVQGNYLVNKAYQYSSITSVTLLDCWTIAWALILTWLFLGTCYSIWQLFGAVVCILGLGLVLLSDAGVGGGGGSRPLLGDVLVIAGTIFFAFSNVGEEFCVKKKDRVEVVSMIGVSGLLVSVVQLSILELKEVESINWSKDIIFSIIGYTLSMFLFYSFAPFALKLSGATMFNLSILTSDMWAVIIRIFFYHQQVDWLYFLSFAIVTVGLIIYSTTKKEAQDYIPISENGDSSVQYQAIEENTASQIGS